MFQRRFFAQSTLASLRAAAPRFVYAGLVVVALGMVLFARDDNPVVERMRASAADVAAPVVEFLSRPVATVTTVINAVQELAHLREENARLRIENERLLRWQAEARFLATEVRKLRKITNFKTLSTSSYVTTRVLADTGGTFAHSVLIAAGAEKGVGKGQAVLAPEGLVGRVTSAGYSTARVLLITDLNSRIPVMVEETGFRAVMTGDNSPQPKLIHLPLGEQISPGQRLVTSGHGGALPPGIPVGVTIPMEDGQLAVQVFFDRSRLDIVQAVEQQSGDLNASSQ